VQHGLKEWGGVLGLPKLEQPNFDAGFTEEWIPYCERDVELNCKVFLVLLEKLFSVTLRNSHTSGKPYGNTWLQLRTA
jgi:hypothetical protein